MTTSVSIGQGLKMWRVNALVLVVLGGGSWGGEVDGVGQENILEGSGQG